MLLEPSIPSLEKQHFLEELPLMVLGPVIFKGGPFILSQFTSKAISFFYIHRSFSGFVRNPRTVVLF